MGWLQVKSVMLVSVTYMFQKLAASMLMLALLLLGSMHPASAHGAGHHHAISQDAEQLIAADHHHPKSQAPGHGCSGCLDCCAMGQCSMVSIALPSGPFLVTRLTRHAAVFGGYAARDAAGPGTAPATPPPRLDA